MKNRPFTHVNVAMTIDGKLDSYLRTGATISSQTDRDRVDRLRARMDAILVGGRTLIQEDPKLTVRSPELRRERQALGMDEHPAKVGVVTIAEIKPDGDYMTAGTARKLIYTTDCTTPEQASILETSGAKVFFLGTDSVDLNKVMESLHHQGIRNLMVEGGGTLIAELFKLELVDELTVYIAPRIFAGASSPTLADGSGFLPEDAPRLHLDSIEPFDAEGGVFVHYTVIH
jgi:2,5-diamino-6-(ribosylamino)-4(3H)-pyrimidinone 5'-phosphate reductase